jgi:hypothetical protein
MIKRIQRYEARESYPIYDVFGMWLTSQGGKRPSKHKSDEPPLRVDEMVFGYEFQGWTHGELPSGESIPTTRFEFDKDVLHAIVKARRAGLLNDAHVSQFGLIWQPILTTLGMR